MQTYVKNLKRLPVLVETILRIAVCFLIPPMLPRCGMAGGLNHNGCTTVRNSMCALFVGQKHFGINTESRRNIHAAPTVAQLWRMQNDQIKMKWRKRKMADDLKEFASDVVYQFGYYCQNNDGSV